MVVKNEVSSRTDNDDDGDSDDRDDYEDNVNEDNDKIGIDKIKRIHKLISDFI